MADQTPTTTFEWDEVPEPVSPTSPFEGLETKVLRVWMENSPSLRRAHRDPASRNQVENAARLAVHEALLTELTLRSQGMAPEQAQEWTRPAMWTPPTWPTTTRSTTPAPLPTRSTPAPPDAAERAMQAMDKAAKTVAKAKAKAKKG